MAREEVRREEENCRRRQRIIVLSFAWSMVRQRTPRSRNSGRTEPSPIILVRVLSCPFYTGTNTERAVSTRGVSSLRPLWSQNRVGLTRLRD